MARFAVYARIIAFVLAAGNLALAVTGFAEVGTGEPGAKPDDVLGAFSVSTILNIVHALAAVGGVVAGYRPRNAEALGWVFFVAFTAFTCYGVVAEIGDSPAEPLNVNWAVNVAHLVTALLGIAMAVLARRGVRDMLRTSAW